MARWSEPSATVASFAFSGAGSRRRIYVPLADADSAGALSGADFATLATLQAPVNRLGYVAGTDVLNGAAIAATTWTDIHANQNFTVTGTGSWLVFQLRLGLHAQAAGISSIAARAQIDSAGTPINVNFAAGIVAAAGQFATLSGGMFYTTNLAAGSHTIKMQVWGDLALTAYCRASSQPNIEWATILVLELSK